jgi:hypothetical protein
MLTLIAEITCLSLAFIAGCFTWKRLSPFFKVLFLQVVVWIVVYTCGNIITYQQQLINQPIDNQWLMNIHLVLETGLLLWAARFMYAKTNGRWFLVLGAIGFTVVYISQVALNGFLHYLHYADLTECIVITLVFAPVLFNSPAGKTGLPLRIACVALLIYFACSVPYVSLMNDLQQHSPKLNSLLYHLISDILANVRYALVALAFVVQYRNNNNEIRK